MEQDTTVLIGCHLLLYLSSSLPVAIALEDPSQRQTKPRDSQFNPFRSQ